MKAYILAAGQGTRMQPLTERTPKPLLPVAGKPVLQHTIDNLKEYIDELIILVGWRAKRLKDDIETYDIPVTYVRQEEQLGTADAVRRVEPYVDDAFLCLNGDVIVSKAAMADFVNAFKNPSRSIMGLVKVDDPQGYGIIETKDGSIKNIIEKPEHPTGNLANAGIYGFDQDIFEAIENTELSHRGEYEITDSLKYIIKKQGLGYHLLPEAHWVEISRPWDLLAANKRVTDLMEMKEKRDGTVEDNVHLEGWVSVEKGARIREGSYIIGPAHIGKDADIGPNAFIRGCTSIGARCRIGGAVEVKNCIIMEDTNIPHHNYIGDSVVGRNCNFGSGTKVANLRLDEKEIVVTHRGKKMNTGLRKLGVIMGDDVKTGINSMINVGTIIGQGTFIGPGAKASGELGQKSWIQ
ncbi:MAG: sugar phosphate nucleotidyltransferase [Thermoplasmata archaeon]